MNQLTILLLEGDYSLCSLSANNSMPEWAITSHFYTITKTNDELSIICESHLVPPEVVQASGWRLLKIAAVLDLSLTGITANFSTALANAGINICVIATYDTDYIMVKQDKVAAAIAALQQAGFIVN
jgi:hypothetical protein